MTAFKKDAEFGKQGTAKDIKGAGKTALWIFLAIIFALFVVTGLGYAIGQSVRGVAADSIAGSGVVLAAAFALCVTFSVFASRLRRQRRARLDEARQKIEARMERKEGE